MILHYDWVKNDNPKEGEPEKFKQYILTLRKNRNGVAPRRIGLDYQEKTQIMTETGGYLGKL